MFNLVGTKDHFIFINGFIYLFEMMGSLSGGAVVLVIFLPLKIKHGLVGSLVGYFRCGRVQALR